MVYIHYVNCINVFAKILKLYLSLSLVFSELAMFETNTFVLTVIYEVYFGGGTKNVRLVLSKSSRVFGLLFGVKQKKKKVVVQHFSPFHFLS